MDYISLDELKTLLDVNSIKRDAVSIFMPTFKTGAETKQNPHVLEKLLAESESQLLSTSFTRAADAHNYLSPVKQLLDDKTAWQHPGNGLAIFLHQDYFRYYSLPLSVKESVSVNYRFSIRPLIPLFNAEGRFYVLALSQNAVRLIQCAHDGTKHIKLGGIVPESMAEANLPQKNERSLQYHTGAPGKGKESVIYHGQGPEKLKENNIALYFQQINKGLMQKLLRDETAPLVIAGVKYLHPIYKKANTYKNLYRDGIDGNPEKVSDAVLREHAVALLKPYFDANKSNAIREYRELAATGHRTDDIPIIATNAYAGQVERLLVSPDSNVWGSFDAVTRTVSLHDKPEPGDLDLIDFAAANTLFHRGSVFVAQPGEIPDGSDAAAVLRHEMHLPKIGHPGTA
ncbi:MAG: hypothetical protein Q7R50_07170 [Dehalococcoidales bacterium]|nr:hypothetical protein [Dehalococcoidales bacterium]